MVILEAESSAPTHPGPLFLMEPGCCGAVRIRKRKQTVEGGNRTMPNQHLLLEKSPETERVILFYNKLESGLMVDLVPNAVGNCFDWTAPGDPGGSEGNPKCFPN
jgi:hypothetical protein